MCSYVLLLPKDIPENWDRETLKIHNGDQSRITENRCEIFRMTQKQYKLQKKNCGEIWAQNRRFQIDMKRQNIVHIGLLS